jgi:iron complex transport system ATP-binding protein
VLHCEKLTVRIGGRTLVRDLDLRLAPGDRVALLGPNGVGKTLTLLTLAGLASPASGTITLGGEPLGSLARTSVAQRLGMLLQDEDAAFPGTVAEAALLGRFAHHGPWRAPASRDLDAAGAALRAVGLDALATRQARELSGGERRRLGLAQALAQQAPLLLLDEPLNHLDPAHAVGIVRHLRGLATTGALGFMASLHDATLARHLATDVLLLFGDGHWERGPADDLLNAATLERLFGTRYTSYRGADGEVLFPAA